MKLFAVLCCFTLIQLLNCEEDIFKDIDGPEIKHSFRIDRIKVYGEQQYLKVAAIIHEDRIHFDLYVMLNRKLGSNYLLMNTSLKAKIQGSKDYKKLLEIKRMDLCAFLTEYRDSTMMRYFFKKSMVLSDFMVCPLRVSNYTVLNINVGENIYPQSLQKGFYKFTVEVVEPIGELPKVFAMQVITEIYS